MTLRRRIGWRRRGRRKVAEIKRARRMAARNVHIGGRSQKRRMAARRAALATSS